MRSDHDGRPSASLTRSPRARRLARGQEGRKGQGGTAEGAYAPSCNTRLAWSRLPDRDSEELGSRHGNSPDRRPRRRHPLPQHRGSTASCAHTGVLLSSAASARSPAAPGQCSVYRNLGSSRVSSAKTGTRVQKYRNNRETLTRQLDHFRKQSTKS